MLMLSSYLGGAGNGDDPSPAVCDLESQFVTSTPVSEAHASISDNTSAMQCSLADDNTTSSSLGAVAIPSTPPFVTFRNRHQPGK